MFAHGGGVVSRRRVAGLRPIIESPRSGGGQRIPRFKRDELSRRDAVASKPSVVSTMREMQP